MAANSRAIKAIHDFLRFQVSDHQTGDSPNISEGYPLMQSRNLERPSVAAANRQRTEIAGCHADSILVPQQWNDEAESFDLLPDAEEVLLLLYKHMGYVSHNYLEWLTDEPHYPLRPRLATVNFRRLCEFLQLIGLAANRR